MNKSCVFAFSFGAIIGSLVTWHYVKTKYERIAQEEIDSVKEVFSKRDPEVPIVKKSENAKMSEEAAKLAHQLGYSTNLKQEGGSDSMAKDKKPYVIPPREFGEEYGYEVVSLTYYADGVLTDEWDDPIQCVDDVVGLDAFTHFGENEDDPDTVYVRNEEFKIDYEILRDERNYSDVTGRDSLTVDE